MIEKVRGLELEAPHSIIVTCTHKNKKKKKKKKIVTCG